MRNTLFSSAPDTNTTNHAGGKAFSLSSKQALAQLAHTGCFGDTYYAEAKDQLKDVLEHAKNCPLEFVAKCAVHARQRGQMKDMPAFLLAYLVCAEGGSSLARKIAPQIIDNGKMLRNFVQVLRSGVLGRKNASSACARKIVQQYFNSRSPERLFKDSVGNAPSLQDVLKLSRPKPDSKGKEALFGYLLGKKHDASVLPELVHHFELFKAGECGPDELPDVPFQMLTGANLKPETWKHIARTATWTTTRMNLNTFARHGVFEDKELTDLIAKRLADPEEVKRSRCFPYQLLMAYRATEDAPLAVREALQDAVEHATQNVPSFGGRVAVGVDTSGSMSSPITQRGKISSQVRCVDVAALIAATIVRKNDTAVIPFDTQAYRFAANRRDSIMTLASQLAKFGGGGTDCSLPLKVLNHYKPSDGSSLPELVVYVSDNESWADQGFYRSTGLDTEWKAYKKLVPNAKLVCIDLTLNTTSQAKPNRPDCLLVGGFSDNVFDVIASFVAESGSDHWVKTIESLDLETLTK